MASIAMLIGGAAINAFAFSGSNYLFSMLRDKNVNKEQERHYKAIEHLRVVQEKWAERRAERLNWINEELHRQQHAVQTFENVDDAMREYAIVFGKSLPDDPEPKLSDFYVPSDEQKDREITFIIFGMLGTGVIAYLLNK